MGRVLVADAIAESAVAKIKAAGLEVVVRNKDSDGPIEEQIKGFDCVVVRSATKITKEVIEAADNLKLVVRAGVGLDNVDQKAAKEKGVEVQNTPEAPTVSVAEMVFSLMFAMARNITQADSSMKDKRWEKKKLTGTELWNKTIGIIGFGRIGREVARRASAFDMEILAYDVIDIDQICMEMNTKRTDFIDLIKNSDYISIHVPLVPQTEGMFGEREFALMKKTAFLVNTARGGVVNEKALLKALNDGEIAGAALDVFEKEPPLDWELVKHPRLIATPHLASSTKEAQVRVGELTADKVIEGLK
ncbi:MAG: D-3-phosphoglycerate dehydrogenase [Candidatus Thorarchaeota archaeon AB_25]|nr:MAG: D-3-phosphoglycerate dehydrogenase [Candidatus Thorarchaeota archaeon AB_25]